MTDKKDPNDTFAEEPKKYHSENKDTETPTNENKGTKTEQEVFLNEQLTEEKNKYIRLFAEFENYKKRTAKERIELFKTASQGVLQTLLPVIDDFERALKASEKEESSKGKEGFTLIYQKLMETLKSEGLMRVEASLGDVFDSDLHEAITQIPAPKEELKGKVIETIAPGYKLNDKWIRYAKVVVGN